MESAMHETGLRGSGCWTAASNSMELTLPTNLFHHNSEAQELVSTSKRAEIDTMMKRTMHHSYKL